MWQVKDRLPHLKVLVKYLPESVEPLDPELKEDGVMTWDEFMDKGEVRPCLLHLPSWEHVLYCVCVFKTLSLVCLNYAIKMQNLQILFPQKYCFYCHVGSFIETDGPCL